MLNLFVVNDEIVHLGGQELFNGQFVLLTDVNPPMGGPLDEPVNYVILKGGGCYRECLLVDFFTQVAEGKLKHFIPKQ